jgi:pimeloyl-ACP methyl ester carboxylesterase
MVSAGRRVSTFEDWRSVMRGLAEEALAEDRLINAAFYYRAAEFYTLTEGEEKDLLYDRFIELFHGAFRDERIERFEIPYQNASLPVIKTLPSSDLCRGTVLMHGGFDSFIEEFYSWMRFFSERGYEVIAFEGPGQGGARRRHGLLFDFEWEKPVRVVLDHFEVDDVTLLGISMGGWLCFRAAAFEPRVARVMASSIAFDYWQFAPPIARKLGEVFFKHLREFTNRLTERKMKRDKMHGWFLGQAMYITGKKTPMDAADVLFQLNERNLHSELVKQDVLILTGREDHFIPFKMHGKQVRALKNARSVTARVFTREEQAHNHCQIGNVGMALGIMVDWIEGVAER